MLAISLVGAFSSFRESKSIQFICQEMVPEEEAAEEGEEARRRSNALTVVYNEILWNKIDGKGNEKIYTLFAPNAQTFTYSV